MERAPRYRNSIEQHIPSDDVLYISPCSGIVIRMSSSEWTQFVFGQLVALGIGTCVLALVVAVVTLWPST